MVFSCLYACTLTLAFSFPFPTGSGAQSLWTLFTLLLINAGHAESQTQAGRLLYPSPLVSSQPRGQIQQLPDVKSHLHWEKRSVRSLCLQFVPLFPLSPGSCGRCRQWCGFLSASCSSALWLNPFQINPSSFQHNSTNTRFLRLLQSSCFELSEECVSGQQNPLYFRLNFSLELHYYSLCRTDSSLHLSHADWGFQVWWPNIYYGTIRQIKIFGYTSV